MPATYATTIAGVSHAIQPASLQISESTNASNVLNAEVVSLTGGYSPSLDDDFVLTENGTRIFGGLVSSFKVVGFGGVGRPGIVNQIGVTDYSTYTDRKYISGTFASGTLKALLTALIALLPGSFGVTLDAAQVNGPTLPDLTYNNKLLRDLLNDLTPQSGGYLWRIDYNKALRMFLPGALTCPFNVVTTDGHALGDIQTEPTRSDFANKIILQAGSTSVVTKNESFTGDGSTTDFTLTYPVAAGATISGWSIDAITLNGSFELVDTGPVPQWHYDSSTNQIQRTAGAPGVGAVIQIQYGAQFPITVTSGSPAVPWEKLVSAPDIYDMDQAQALADGLLAQYNVTKQTVYIKTQQLGAHPGQTLTVTQATRAASGTYLITDVQTTNPSAGNVLWRTITAVSGTQFTGTWQGDYKAITGGSSASSVTVAGQFSNIPAIVEWSEDDGGGTTQANWLPKQDSVQQVGDQTHRLLAVYMASGGVGYRFIGTSGDVGVINFNTHPALPQMAFSVFNGSSVGGTVSTFYKEGIDAIFRSGGLGAGLRILDATEAHKLLVKNIQTLTGDRIVSLLTPDADFDINWGPWSAYPSPVTWAASGTAPAIGNGTVTGVYCRRGKNVMFRIDLQAGSTTTFGTGNWTFTTPTTQGSGRHPTLSNVIAYDSSAGAVYGGQPLQSGSTTTIGIYVQGTANQFGPTVPFTWASSDRFILEGTYEEA